jgi:hypothetical protein
VSIRLTMCGFAATGVPAGGCHERLVVSSTVSVAAGGHRAVRDAARLRRQHA